MILLCPAPFLAESSGSILRHSEHFGTMSGLVEPLMSAHSAQLEPDPEHDLEAHLFNPKDVPDGCRDAPN